MDEISWKTPMLFGLFLALVGFYSIISLNIPSAVVLILFGVLHFIFGSWLWIKDSEDDLAIEGEKQFRIKGHKDSVPWENSDLHPENEVSVFEKHQIKVSVSEKQETKIYSEILKKDVRKCCYQTARLKDKYCVCGRGWEYPAET